MAAYIKLVRPADSYIEFVFPPGSMNGQVLPLIFFNGGYLPVLDPDKTTHIKVNLTNDELFEYLIRKHADWLNTDTQVYCIATSAPPPPSSYCYNYKMEFTPEGVEEIMNSDQNLYRQTIRAMEDLRLAAQFKEAIKLENYEHAAIIRDEINSRKWHHDRRDISRLRK